MTKYKVKVSCPRECPFSNLYSRCELRGLRRCMRFDSDMDAPRFPKRCPLRAGVAVTIK